MELAELSSAVTHAYQWSVLVRIYVKCQLKTRNSTHTITALCSSYNVPYPYLRYRGISQVPIFRTPLHARRPSVVAGPSE